MLVNRPPMVMLIILMRIISALPLAVRPIIVIAAFEKNYPFYTPYS